MKRGEEEREERKLNEERMERIEKGERKLNDEKRGREKR